MLGDAADGSFDVKMEPVAAESTGTFNETMTASGCSSPAPSGADMCWPNGAVATISSGERTATFQFSVLGDAEDERDETLTFKAIPNNSVQATMWTAGTITLTIVDDDGAPGAPMGLVAVAGDRQTTLNWDESVNASITGWQYQMKSGNSNYGDWTDIAGSSASTSSHTITNLANGTAYGFKIRAMKGNTSSAASDEVIVTPMLAPTPGKPKGVAVTASRGGTIVVTWDDPKDPSITGWQMRWAFQENENLSSQEWWNVRSDITSYGTAPYDFSREVGMLLVFQVRAVNANGAGVASDVVAATPFLSEGKPPSKPTGFTAAPRDGSVVLTWNPILRERDATWQIRMASQAEGVTSKSWQDLNFDRTDYAPSNYNVTGLTNGTSYVFQVRARNIYGVGPASDVVSAVPTRTPTPGKPLHFTAEAGDSRVGLFWSGPIIGEGLFDANIVGWQVRSAPQEEGLANKRWKDIRESGSHGNHTVIDLTNGIVYVFQVRAVNIHGAGLASDVVTAVPMESSGGVPAKPTRLTATIMGWHIRLKYDSMDNSNIVAMEYRLRIQGSDWESWQRSSGKIDILIINSHDLQNVEYYEFQVRAVNANGRGPVSDIVSAVPAKPTGVQASVHGRRIVLTWDDPMDSSIIRWEKRDDLACFNEIFELCDEWSEIYVETSGQFKTYWNERGGPPGTSYKYQVRAVNANGFSEPSVVVMATPRATPAGVTVSESELTVREGGSESYTIKLNQAPSGTVTITVGGESGDVTVDKSSLTFTRGNWTTEQVVTVFAKYDMDTTTDPDVTLTHSASGGGYDSITIDSVVVSVIEYGNAVPAKPTGLIAFQGYAHLPDCVTVNWDDPKDSSITKWQSRIRHRSWQGQWSPWSDLLHLDTELPCYIDYRNFTLSQGETLGIQIRAVNPNGYSEVSDTLEVLIRAPVPGPEPEPIRPLISASDVTVDEGDSGETNMDFTVTLSDSPSHDVEIRATAWSRDAIDIAKGGKGAGRDFIGFRDRNLVFPANATGADLTKIVTVKVLGDEVEENDETLVLRLNNIRTGDPLVAFENGRKRLEVIGTIMDDDAAKSTGHEISVSDVTVDEGDSGETDMEFTVTLSGSPSHDVEIRATAWARPGTAKGGRGAGRDFVGFRDQNLVFAANATGRDLTKMVTVRVLGDEVDEDDETFTLRLNNIRTSDRRVVFEGGKKRLEATGTIMDDDTAGVTVSDSALTVAEGGSGSYTVHLDSRPAGGDVTVTVAGASGDVRVVPASLTFTSTNYGAPQMVTVSADEDEDATADPAVVLTHGASGGGYDSVTIDSVTVTVAENDGSGG